MKHKMQFATFRIMPSIKITSTILFFQILHISVFSDKVFAV